MTIPKKQRRGSDGYALGGTSFGTSPGHSMSMTSMSGMTSASASGSAGPSSYGSQVGGYGGLGMSSR